MHLITCTSHTQLPSPCDTQVYVESLVPNVPVHLNKKPVVAEAAIEHNGIITIGTCSFRVDYHGGVVPGSPLKEESNTASPKKVRSTYQFVSLDVS